MPPKRNEIRAEKTQPQVIARIDEYQGILHQNANKPNEFQIRCMRKQPTIALTRQLIIAPVLAAKWNYKEELNAPEGAAKFIETEMKKWRMFLLRTTFQGYIDYGWQPYERVYKLRSDGFVGIKKLKSLLHRLTKIRVDPETGAYNGLIQTAFLGKQEITLSIPEALCITIDTEGTDWYGHSIFETTESAYRQYEEARKGADRYDRKVAGSHWVIHYPPGDSDYDGEILSNDKIAQRILDKLESSGKIAVPRALEAYIDEMGKADNAWKIELLSDTSSATSNFIERLKYLDNLLVRTFGVPERSILEGSFGTKAEAESHGEAAVLNMDMRHRLACVQYNEYLVNALLRINYGEEYENSVYIEPGPLDSKQKILLSKIYDRLLQNPVSAPDEINSIDTALLKSEIGIPVIEEYDTIREGLSDVLRQTARGVSFWEG